IRVNMLYYLYENVKRNIRYNIVCSSVDCSSDLGIKFKTKKHGRGIEETYFKCEFCVVKTPCYFTNNKVRKLIKENKDLRETPIVSDNDKIVIDKNHQYITAKMDELKERYSEERRVGK